FPVSRSPEPKALSPAANPTFRYTDTLYGRPRKHQSDRERHEHHLPGDIPANADRELPLRSGTSARGEVPGTFSRDARAATRRERPGEVRCVLPVCGRLSVKLHLYRGSGEH